MAALIAVLLFFVSIAEGCSQDAVHSAFSLTQQDLELLVSDLAPEARQGILSKPKDFLGLMAGALDGPQDLLVLVDKAHPLPRDGVPPDLVPLERYPLLLTKKGLSLRAVIVPDLLQMAEAARSQGTPLPVSSTYRSYAVQTALYQTELKTKSKEEVEKQLAPPDVEARVFPPEKLPPLVFDHAQILADYLAGRY
jgi:LAS superfamily LD-carboxypeptidase LdcB